MVTTANFYVYLMFRLDGRPCYVGKGKGARWRHHGKYGRNRHLLNIIKQARAQGQELHRVKVRENMSEAEAFMLEKELIAFYGREDIDTGILVNLTDGGDGPAGYKMPPELRAHHSAIKRGLKQTPESNAKRSAALKGRRMPAEQRAKLSASQRGKKKLFGWWSTEDGRAKQRANNPTVFKSGHEHSDETINKLRAARLSQQNVSDVGRFKPGHQLSEESRAKLSAAIRASWAKRRTTSAGCKGA